MPDRGERDSESFEHAFVFIGDGVLAHLNARRIVESMGKLLKGKLKRAPVCACVRSAAVRAASRLSR